jgi:thiol-disulfide isomerase/thioredoxin
MRAFIVVAAVLALASCEEKSTGPAPSRFDSVKKPTTSTAANNFCERQWSTTEGAKKKFVAPPEKPIPGAPAIPDVKAGSWKWVNLWATWCHPCVDEIPLLARWKTSLEKDGIPVDLEMWSVDEDQTALTSWLQKTAMPGHVRWVRSPDDLPAVLEGIGADKGAAIPIHVLIDGNGNLRCLRVGAVHDEDYGAIKSILSGA